MNFFSAICLGKTKEEISRGGGEEREESKKEKAKRFLFKL
jgi:hypothetical protein